MNATSPDAQATQATGASPPSPSDLVHTSQDMACLYCIAGQLDSCGGSSDALLQGILTTLRHAWQQPQYTCVRITCNDREYKTENFTPSARAGRASIEVDGKTVGWLEVDFLHGMPNRPTGNIADTDTILLTAVARCTGRALGHLQARRQLEVERESLQNTNIAMREVLARTREGELELRRAVQANVDKIILPIIDALTAVASDEQKHYVALLRSNLEEITAPFTGALSRSVEGLTPIEIQTCDMIRRGMSTKQIAHTRCVSPATVSRHREHIRRKLGITNQSVNLSSYLLSLGAERAPESAYPFR